MIKSYQKRAVTIYVTALIFLVGLLFGCKSPKTAEETWLKLEGEAMGTTYHITVQNVEDERAKFVVDSVLNIINEALSTYDPNSYISRFNESDSGFVISMDGDEERIKLFKAVWDVSKLNYELSEGAFDPSASPLFNIWGFAEKDRKGIPSKGQIDTARLFVGFNNTLFPNYRKLYRESSLNFNAVAKGFGVDCVLLALQKEGAENVMVEIGGEVRAIGFNDKGEAWKIGINKPQIDALTTDFIEVVELKNQSMATSGNYRNFFEHEGKRYSHTIDPRTGFPIVNDLKSVTIIANDCATADALATACMVLGAANSMRLIEKLTDVEAILITESSAGLDVKKIVGKSDPKY